MWQRLMDRFRVRRLIHSLLSKLLNENDELRLLLARIESSAVPMGADYLVSGKHIEKIKELVRP